MHFEEDSVPVFPQIEENILHQVTGIVCCSFEEGGFIQFFSVPVIDFPECLFSVLPEHLQQLNIRVVLQLEQN
jgi:hypothetical protein